MIDLPVIQQLIDPIVDKQIGRRASLDATLDKLRVVVPYLAHPHYGSHYTALKMTIARALGKTLDIACDYAPPALSQQPDGDTKTLPGVKNIVAVGSGKGGVGKSTVALLLARATALLGARVGLLDADIYGPNQLRLMGVPANTRLEVTGNNRFVPLLCDDIAVMSFGGISDENTPVVWRGPMISSALQQLLLHTNWPELDLLVVDLPPGTGDIQLTLASAVKLAGLVLVTTPQALAVSEAGKTLAMAGKLRIPLLGYVENMAMFVCPGCQSEHRLFGQMPTEELAELSRLGSLPLQPDLQNASGELNFTPQQSSGIEAIQIAESVSLALAKLNSLSNIIARQ